MINFSGEVSCSALQFACSNKCIPLTWQCDGDMDCQGGEDEKGCGKYPGKKIEQQLPEKKNLLANFWPTFGWQMANSQLTNDPQSADCCLAVNCASMRGTAIHGGIFQVWSISFGELQNT